jgi:hypothetical protein
MARVFANPCLQSYYLETKSFTQTFIYAGHCRAKGEQLVSPFPNKTPQRSEQETLHLVLIRNQIPLELSYYIVNQYLYQNTNPEYHHKIIEKYLDLKEKKKKNDYQKVRQYGEYLFGPRFLEDVDHIPFFNNWYGKDVSLPFQLEPSPRSGNMYVERIKMVHVESLMRRHLIKHYSLATLQNQVGIEKDPKTNMLTEVTILDYLIDHYIGQEYDVIEHCLVVMPLNVVMSLLRRILKPSIK